MNKKIKIIIAIIFLVVFLFLPLIPDHYVFRTKAQKEKMTKFCEQHGCGLIFLISPYEYIKDSIYNIIVQD